MRTKRTDPAVCPRCEKDFSSSGRCRYQRLKRHIREVHSVVDVDREMSVQNLLTPDVMSKLEMGDGCVIVRLFDALHCNLEYPDTHIASIPNVSKDCMLVMVREGEVRGMSKVEGAKRVIDHVMEKDVPRVQAQIDDRYKFVPDIIRHMEALPRVNRTRMSNVLKECVGST